MSMSMSCGLRLRQELRTKLRLTQEQRLVIENRLLVVQIQLVGALRGERYEPRATCPECSKVLTPIEIINGFNQEPTDFTTCCPKCQCRFAPCVISFGRASSIELPFYCSAQALDQLRGKQLMTPAELSKHHPAVYRSAIIHHSTITKAFRLIDVEYPFPEVGSWKNKVRPFLGQLSDKAIAGCVEVSPKTIAQMRKESGIEPFNWRRTPLEEKASKRRKG